MGSLPLGVQINNLELKPYSGSKLSRSAGCFSVILRKANKVLVKLSSGKFSFFSKNCRATFGVVANSTFFLKKFSKAGSKCWFGRKPHVRGTAINAVDHPHGGGEGKSRIGRFPVSPWGKLCKSKKTRKLFLLYKFCFSKGFVFSN